MEDTEWNSVLRDHGILPKEVEVTEEHILEMVDQKIQQMVNKDEDLDGKTLNELDELEDEIDERVILEYRKKRMAEMEEMVRMNKFGQVYKISAQDFVDQVTETSKTDWVVVHLYKEEYEQCQLLNSILQKLASKFRATKFVKIISTDCIQNYPDKNLPTILVYGMGDLKKQLIGYSALGGAPLKDKNVEIALAKTGAIASDAKDDERVNSILMGNYKSVKEETESDSDWD